MLEAIKADSPTLGKIARDISPEAAVLQLEKMCAVIFQFCNIQVNESLLELGCKMMFENITVKNLKLCDLDIIQKEILGSKIYGVIDMQKIMTHVNEYWDSRIHLAGQSSEQTHSTLQQGERNKPFPFSTNINKL